MEVKRRVGENTITEADPLKVKGVKERKEVTATDVNYNRNR